MVSEESEDGIVRVEGRSGLTQGLVKSEGEQYWHKWITLFTSLALYDIV